MLLLWANSFAKACSMEANPFETMIILCFSLGPLFDSLNEDMRENTEKRTNRIDEILPISTTEISGKKSTI
jgi:hypothetical protein